MKTLVIKWREKSDSLKERVFRYLSIKDEFEQKGEEDFGGEMKEKEKIGLKRKDI